LRFLDIELGEVRISGKFATFRKVIISLGNGGARFNSGKDREIDHEHRLSHYRCKHLYEQ
jgi:hypothetical protein